MASPRHTQHAGQIATSAHETAQFCLSLGLFGVFTTTSAARRLFGLVSHAPRAPRLAEAPPPCCTRLNRRWVPRGACIFAGGTVPACRAASHALACRLRAAAPSAASQGVQTARLWCSMCGRKGASCRRQAVTGCRLPATAASHRMPPPLRPGAVPSRMGLADSPPTSWKGPITPEEHGLHAKFVEAGLPVELPCSAPSYLVQKGALHTGACCIAARLGGAGSRLLHKCMFG